MRIGFDAKRAAQNRTGLGNYSRFVINMMLENRPEDEYLLYIPSPRKNEFIVSLPSNARIATPDGAWKAFPSLWRSAGIASSLSIDGIGLYHGLSNELPLGISKLKFTRSVVTIHDLIFLRYPSYYKKIDRCIYNFKFRKACADADRVIAVSQCTKRDVMSFYGIAENKIDVVYQGCDKAFAAMVDDERKAAVARSYGLPSNYILYVGSIEERKNLMLLAKSMLFSKHRFHVVAVGKRTRYADEVQSWLSRHGLSSRLTMLHGVPFADLPAIYQMADVFVYPSRYEGFGIPLLEALNSRIPVIGATGSCLEEAGGPSSLYVDPDDPEMLASNIDIVLDDSQLRASMVEGGLLHASKFVEKELLGGLLQTYARAMQH